MRWLNQQWYCEKSFFVYCLSPLSWLYRIIISVRRFLYRCGLKKVFRFPVPIIVVGNITLGGTGKTPLVSWLADWLRLQGFKPGIVSRGYGGKAVTWPQTVTENSDPQLVGDEAVLLAQHAHCPMVVDPNRVAAVNKLLNNYDCDVIISDDGLQHYALGRDIEIAVIDGARRFGNGFCLPAGPLREPIKRLKSVDFIIANGKGSDNEYTMRFHPGVIYNIKNPKLSLNIASLNNNTVHAVAAIGHPQRFFKQLKTMGFNVVPHEFPDHYSYRPADFNFGDDATIIMTAKDAVKCRSFANDRYWCLPVHVQMDEHFEAALRASLLQLLGSRT